MSIVSALLSAQLLAFGTGVTDWEGAYWGGPIEVISPLWGIGTVISALVAVAIWIFYHILDEVREARTEKAAVREWLEKGLPEPYATYVQELTAAGKPEEAES